MQIKDLHAGGNVTMDHQKHKARAAKMRPVLMVYKICVLLLGWSILPRMAVGQTLTITTPSAHAVIQSYISSFAASTSSAPTAYRLDFQMNGKYFDTCFVGGLTSCSVPFYPGWYGDGASTVQATAKDVFGNVVATSSLVPFLNRTIGFPFSLPSISATGSVTICAITFDGLCASGQNPGNCAMQVDGQPESTNWSNLGVCWQKVLNTTRFPNGPREIYISSQNNTANPAIRTSTFVPGGVSGTNITSSWHEMVTNRPIALTTTGTLPSCSTGCTVTPLQVGAQWFGTATSGQTNTFSVTCASTACTVTTSSAHGLIAGSRVNIDGMIFSSTFRYPVALNGAWTVLASPAPTVTTFALSVPGIADGTYATYNSQLITNPYYPTYVDNNTVTLAETPSGAPITFTAGGTGTHTVHERITTWFSNLNNSDLPGFGVPIQGFSYGLVTFSNGSSPMELRPPYRELYLCVTPTTGCPSTVSIAPYIENTDLSTTSISASSVTYTLANQATTSTVLSVDSSGNVTALNPGWATITVACTTCSSGSSLPTVTVYAKVFASTPTFNTYSHAGQRLTSYVPGSSFFPNPLWNLTITDQYLDAQAARRLSWTGQIMNESNINASTENMGGVVSQPDFNTCLQAINEAASDSALYSAATSIGSYIEALSTPWNVIQDPLTGLPGFGSFINNASFNRQQCYGNWVQTVASSGRVFTFRSPDEYNPNEGASTPRHNGIVGQNPFSSLGFSPYFSQLACDGINCVATTSMSFLGAWNQTAGTGDGIYIQNATTASAVNGFHLVTSSTTNSTTGLTTSLTFPSTIAAGTYNASTDPAMELVYFFTSNPRRCGLPSQAGISLAMQMPFAPIQITAATNANPSIYTVNPNFNNSYPYPSPVNGSTITVSGFTGSWAAENGACVVAGGGIPPQQTFHCSTVNGSPVNASGFGPITGSPVFTPDLSSMVASGGTLTVNWANHALSNGQIVYIRSATNTSLQTIAQIANVTANTFTVPTVAANGTYNYSTDPNLYITVDCQFPNNTFDILVNTITSNGGPMIAWTMLGSSITSTNTQGVYQSMGDPGMNPAPLAYVAQAATPIYGKAGSVAMDAASQIAPAYQLRPWEAEPRRMLISLGASWLKQCAGYGFHPECGSTPDNALIRPESALAQIFNSVIAGMSGYMIYNYDRSMISENSTAFGLQTGEFAISHQTSEFSEMWTAVALANALIKRLEPYLLQPRINTPYFGSMLPATVHQNSNNTARLLLIQCQSETQYPAQTLNFTMLGLSYPSGTILKYVLDSRKLVTSQLSGATDAYIGCAGSPGDVTAYIFLAPGASSPLDNVTFSAAATLPFGSSKMAIRVGYYPRYKGLLNMQDTAATDCTAGCIIPVDHSNADAWYQILYVDSNNLVKGVGDPQKIAKVN